MKERVGARHWLILGMLSQMPGEAMHIHILSSLAHAHCPGIPTRATVRVLEVKGLVEFSVSSLTVRLTELGATRRRQAGRPETSWFAYVPDAYVRAA